MSSPNDPILQQILDKLSGIDTRLENLETKVGNLESQMTSVNAYIRTEASIQEAVDTQKFMSACDTHTMIPAKVFNIKEFYNTDNTYLTDIDGCVLLGDEAYIIESKHALKPIELRQKLRQFCTIESILQDIRSNKTPRVKGTQFDTMAAKLESFPEKVYLIFSSDSMNASMRKFIMAVNEGNTNAEDKSLVDVFKESPLYAAIQASSDVEDWAKKELEKATQSSKILDITNIPKARFELFQSRIREHFDVHDPCFPSLVGKIGILHLGKVTWPQMNKTNLVGTNVIGYTQLGGRKTRRSKSRGSVF
jgi:hypothetical protein